MTDTGRTIYSSGTERALRLLGPYSIAHDTAGVVSSDTSGLTLTPELPDGTVIHAAWAEGGTGWSPSGAGVVNLFRLFLNVCEAGDEDNNFSEIISYDLTQSQGGDFGVFKAPIRAALASHTPSRVTLPAVVRAQVLITTSEGELTVGGGSSDVYVLTSNPA